MIFSLNQTIVYWPPAGVDQYATLQLGIPVEFEYARWDDAQSNAINAQGNIVVSSASVYLDGDDVCSILGWGVGIQLQGLMSLGCLADAMALPLPVRGNYGVHEIIAVNKTPDLQNLQVLWRIQLK